MRFVHYHRKMKKNRAQFAMHILSDSVTIRAQITVNNLSTVAVVGTKTIIPMKKPVKQHVLKNKIGFETGKFAEKLL